MEDCLFCKIAKKEIPSSIIYEDEYVIAFRDISPVTPVHILVIPKIHIADCNQIDEKNSLYVTKCMMAIKEVAKICGIDKSGYRVISNVGEDGGQAIHHLHFHVLGGTKLGLKIV